MGTSVEYSATLSALDPGREELEVLGMYGLWWEVDELNWFLGGDNTELPGGHFYSPAVWGVCVQMLTQAEERWSPVLCWQDPTELVFLRHLFPFFLSHL